MRSQREAESSNPSISTRESQENLDVMLESLPPVPPGRFFPFSAIELPAAGILVVFADDATEAVSLLTGSTPYDSHDFRLDKA